MNCNYQTALFTDFYELTMAQGYWKRHMTMPVVFDYFFRRHPFGGGYSVFAGLATLMEALEGFSFSKEDLEYLSTLGLFEDGFLDHLSSFKFKGTIYAAREGEIVFPQEPLVRVEADLISAQIVEGLILQCAQFPKSHCDENRTIWNASGRGAIMELAEKGAGRGWRAFGEPCGFYRRGGRHFQHSRGQGVRYSGAGDDGTLVGHVLPSELEAFDAYAEIYPKNTYSHRHL